jgi:hypothetical protein
VIKELTAKSAHEREYAEEREQGDEKAIGCLGVVDGSEPPLLLCLLWRPPQRLECAIASEDLDEAHDEKYRQKQEPDDPTLASKYIDH